VGTRFRQLVANYNFCNPMQRFHAKDVVRIIAYSSANSSMRALNASQYLGRMVQIANFNDDEERSEGGPLKQVFWKLYHD
jgi:hypothetical protein